MKLATRQAGTGWIPLLGLAVASGALVLSTDEGERDLAAATQGSLLGPDSDLDGLADKQEYILRTNPDEPDTDQDGYHDIEEVARGSDPLQATSIPDGNELSVAEYMYIEDDILKLHVAVYVRDGDIDDLGFEFGLVVKGLQVPVSRKLILRGARSFFYNALKRSQDLMLVLEMPIPERTAFKLGDDLHTYAKVWDKDPVNPRFGAVDTASIFLYGEEHLEAISAPSEVRGGNGLVYRPLTAESPAGSASGQICWQRVEAVGSNGSSILYEISAASCEDFDSFCSASSCSATVGGVLELPDPGAILGG